MQQKNILDGTIFINDHFLIPSQAHSPFLERYTNSRKVVDTFFSSFTFMFRTKDTMKKPLGLSDLIYWFSFQNVTGGREKKLNKTNQKQLKKTSCLEKCVSIDSAPRKKNAGDIGTSLDEAADNFFCRHIIMVIKSKNSTTLR